MGKRIFTVLTMASALAACSAQDRPSDETQPGASQAIADHQPTFITGDEVQAVLASNPIGDNPIKSADLGEYNVGVSVLRRTALKAGGPINAIAHMNVTEVYYIVSGEGTLVTGGKDNMTDLEAVPADSELVTSIVGPSNTGIMVEPAVSRRVKANDMVIIPPGVYHSFSEIPDHVEYVTVRPDFEKILPGDYVNPALATAK